MTGSALFAGGLAAVAAVCSAAAVVTAREGVINARVFPASAHRATAVRSWSSAPIRSALSVVGSWPVAARLGGSAIVRSVGMLGAGSPSVPEVVGTRVVAGVCGAMIGAVLRSPALAFGLAVLGLMLPGWVLARAARARTRRADSELPQLLDLLAAASHAGLAGPLALRRASSAIEGPLADELARVLRAVDLGARWRDELSAMADRLDLPDLRRTVAALTRTERLGASLAGSVSDLATRVRQARRAATTERARTAPVKMLFPLVFLVLPAFLLLTVVPVLFSTVRSIR